MGVEGGKAPWGDEVAGGLGGRSPLVGAKRPGGLGGRRPPGSAAPEGVQGERISPARDTSEPVMMLAVEGR